MRILWGAVRAASVETLGVLVILWTLHGASGLAIDAPWRMTSMTPANVAPRVDGDTLIVKPVPAASVAINANAQVESQRGTAPRWFKSLIPAWDDNSVERTDVERTDVEHRAEYARQQLEHFSQLYGIATRDS